MEHVLTPIGKNDLVLLGLLAAASATDGAIQKNILNSGWLFGNRWSYSKEHFEFWMATDNLKRWMISRR